MLSRRYCPRCRGVGAVAACSSARLFVALHSLLEDVRWGRRSARSRVARDALMFASTVWMDLARLELESCEKVQRDHSSPALDHSVLSAVFTMLRRQDEACRCQPDQKNDHLPLSHLPPLRLTSRNDSLTMARKYARLPSCDADATLDDMHARYGQTSPGSMPLEAMAKIARLLEEDDLERRRENRKLMVLITSILVVCVAVHLCRSLMKAHLTLGQVALTGASGLRETRFNSFSKRDVCKPSAAQGAPIAITIQPAAVAPGEPARLAPLARAHACAGEAPAPRQCAVRSPC